MSSLRPVRGPTPEVVDALRSWLGEPAEPEPLVVETSGSTGAPKRVALSRRAVLSSVAATQRRLGAEGQWYLALPVTHVAGVQVVVRSLVAGHEPVLVHDTFAETSPRVTAGEAPRFTSLVPTQLHRLLDDPSETAVLRGMHTILLGGGPIEPALRRRAAESGLRLVATYGSSETAGGCVYDGRPLDGVRLDVLGDGRIRIAGPMLFDGYLDDPEATAAALVDGWFVTADAGRLAADGTLEVAGRVDDMVVSGGVNVPLPVVAARLRAHPGVRAVEVVGVPDAEWGRRVVAFVVGDLTLEDARDWVGGRHPRSWAPRTVVPLDALPLLETGKVDRVALAALAGAP